MWQARDAGMPIGYQSKRTDAAISPESGAFARTIAGWRTEIGVAAGLILLIALFSALAPNFATIGNLVSVLKQLSVTAMVAVGMTMVVIVGEIDLSVGASLGLSGTVFALLIVRFGLSAWLSFVGVLVLATAIGSFIGVLRVIWGIPSFITTIGLLSSMRGIAFWLSDSETIGPLPAAVGNLWFGDVASVPTPIIITIAIVALGWFVLSETPFGRHLYAVGGNAVTAARYGVHVNRIRVLVFILVQALAALGGVMLAARLNGGSATVGDLFELDVIAAVIVGGTRLSGGAGRMIGTILGVLFVATLRNGMVLLGVDPILFMIAQGFVIILAVWWSMLRSRGWRVE
jgi:ribose/xylose/arabinose/galactoside ABC-type transport system permease subunit